MSNKLLLNSPSYLQKHLLFKPMLGSQICCAKFDLYMGKKKTTLANIIGYRCLLIYHFPFLYAVFAQ